MHSGRGEEASDHTYRLLPIPQEPHLPAADEAREGVVLPAQGEHWDQPTQVVQPTPGQPWDQPQQPPAAAGETGAEAEKTQLIAPYAAPDAERTQMLAPQGLPESESTQLLPPYPAPPADAEGARQLRQPLPPEQSFGAAVPPLPAGVPTPPPQPPSPPFAIRPGTPADSPGSQHDEGVAAATQQLPLYGEPAVQQPQQPLSQQPLPQQPGQQAAPQSAQDDYDYLYRRDGQTASPAPPAAGYSVPQYGHDQQAAAPQYGYTPPAAAPAPASAPPFGRGRGKLSPPALIGIIVAACAAVGLAAGAALSGGGDQNADSATPVGSTSAPAVGAGDPATQAKELDALLKDSNNSRSAVINAVATIKTCGNLAQAAADLRSAAAQRNNLVTRLGRLTVDKLPDHDQLVARLNTAWQASAAADEHYAAWADQADCRKGHAKVTAEAAQGNRSSGEATIAKKAAADLWNPIASQYGLTQRQFSDL